MKELDVKSSYIKNIVFLSPIALILLLIKPVFCIIFLSLGLVIVILYDFRIGLFILAGLSVIQIEQIEILESYHISVLCLMVTFISYIFYVSRNVKFQFNISPAFKWLWAFLFVVIISGLYAESNALWLKELIDFVRVLVIFFLVIQCIEDENTLYIMGKMIVIFIFVSSLFSLVNPSAGGMVLRLLRFTGMTSDPNQYAMILCGALPLVFFYVKNERDILVKFFFIICGLAFLFFIIISQSRGGFIAAAIVIVLTVQLIKKNALIISIFIICFVIILTLVPAQFFFHRIMQLFNIFSGKSLSDPSFVHRLLILKSAVRVFLEHPIFGVGANNFLVHSVRFSSPSLCAHNMFAEIAADFGLLGFLPFVMIIFSPFLWFSKYIKSAEIHNRKALSSFIQFIRISLIGLIIAGLFLSSQSRPYLWLIISMIYATRSVSQRISRPQTKIGIKC